jgi:ligand-binding sensor domain-containing protein
MSHRPVAVAIDDAGHVWAGGRYGLLHHDGATWSFLPLASDSLAPGTPSLPLSDIRDVEVDAQGRIWLLGPSEILVLSP